MRYATPSSPAIANTVSKPGVGVEVGVGVAVGAGVAVAAGVGVAVTGTGVGVAGLAMTRSGIATLLVAVPRVRLTMANHTWLLPAASAFSAVTL